MKHILFIPLFSLLLSSQAWAEGTQPRLTKDLVHTPAITEIIEAPKLSRKDHALLHLSLIRDEVDLIQESGFFGSLFTSNSELEETLRQDLDLFLTIFSDLDIASEALLLKGQLQVKQGYYKAAVITWLQNLYAFPASDSAIQTRQYLTTLLENEWSEGVDLIQPIMRNVPNTDQAGRLSKLIIQLYPINDIKITKALTNLQIDFLKQFPENRYADDVQVLLAHNLGSVSAESGVFSFKKLLALYPNSPYQAEAMLAIADLQRLRLNAYEKAASNYQTLIKTYPQHPLIKNAYHSLALTYEEDLKDYVNAIKTYRILVQRYPEDKMALSALQNMAYIQSKKTSEPGEAIATLRKLASMFHGPEAIEALDGAINIAHNKLKNLSLANEIRQQLVHDYPNSDSAPKALFKMAEYAEEKLQDNVKARQLYQQFIQQYPDEHLLVKKAEKRL